MIFLRHKVFNQLLQINYRLKMIKITASQRKDTGSFFSLIVATQGARKIFKIKINFLQEQQSCRIHSQTETDLSHITPKWPMKVQLPHQTIWITTFQTDILGEQKRIMSMISQSAQKANLKMLPNYIIWTKMIKRNLLASRILKAFEEIQLNNTSTKTKELESLIQMKVG